MWQPGDPIEEGEELEYDRSSYQCFHQLGFEWPCLSFDLMSDNLGDNRKSFPLTQYMVAGTQAPMARGQVLAIARLARMGQGGHGDKAKKEEASEDEDEMSDSDDDDDNGEEPPLMAFRQLAHPGCVNRVRAMPQQPTLVATWSERGTVQVLPPTPLTSLSPFPSSPFNQRCWPSYGRFGTWPHSWQRLRRRHRPPVCRKRSLPSTRSSPGKLSEAMR